MTVIIVYHVAKFLMYNEYILVVHKPKFIIIHYNVTKHGNCSKKFELNYEHNRQKFLALQHNIIGKIKSIIGWCLQIMPLKFLTILDIIC